MACGGDVTWANEGDWAVCSEAFIGWEGWSVVATIKISWAK
jgi:hypothetical protein